MQVIVFCGVQGGGKTTYYREHFFGTHIRLSLDMLRTRHRERLLYTACLEAKQPVVIDNTNATAKERSRYIALAKAHRFEVICYWFDTPAEILKRRNEERPLQERVPPAGLFGTLKSFEPPAETEGFDSVVTDTNTKPSD